MKQDLKIKKMSAADMVCDQMKKLILDNTWPVDTKIPSEIELAEIFDVNRLTVRVALQKLNALGILDVRVGDGTYVRTFKLETLLIEVSDFYVNEKLLNDVTEHRLIIELECARLAIHRATPDELSDLKKCCEEFEQEILRYYTIENPGEAYQSFLKTVDISLNFQVILCKMSHNELLCNSFTLAKEPLRQHMILNATKRINDKDSEYTNLWGTYWWNIYHAILNKDYPTCSKYLRKIIASEETL